MLSFLWLHLTFQRKIIKKRSYILIFLLQRGQFLSYVLLKYRIRIPDINQLGCRVATLALFFTVIFSLFRRNNFLLWVIKQKFYCFSVFISLFILEPMNKFNSETDFHFSIFYLFLHWLFNGKIMFQIIVLLMYLASISRKFRPILYLLFKFMAFRRHCFINYLECIVFFFE